MGIGMSTQNDWSSQTTCMSMLTQPQHQYHSDQPAEIEWENIVDFLKDDEELCGLDSPNLHVINPMDESAKGMEQLSYPERSEHTAGLIIPPRDIPPRDKGRTSFTEYVENIRDADDEVFFHLTSLRLTE